MQQAIFISLIGMMLPTILLSGFIFPIENMPKIYDYVSMIMPPRYFIVIIKNIMIKGTGFMYIWKETLVLIVMTMVFIGISVRKFKIRLNKRMTLRQRCKRTGTAKGGTAHDIRRQIRKR